MQATEFSRLYLLSDPHIGGALHVRPQSRIGDAFALFRGDETPAGRVVFTRAEGRVPKDLVGTTLVPLYLLSDRVIEALRGFTGWSTFPVHVHGADGGYLPGYHGLVVTGRCGKLEESRNETVFKTLVPGAEPAPFWKGMHFDEDSWDGSDVFAPAGTGFIVVTEAVKEALERARVSNVRLRRLSEVERLIPPSGP